MKSIFLMLWGLWDWLYYRFNRMQYVCKDTNLFRIVRKTYRGPSLQTLSGEWIQYGDEIIKLHLYNYRLAKELNKYPENRSLAIFLKRNIEHSLQGLSTYLNELPDKEKIKGIIGTTMLNRGAERLGFKTHEVEENMYYLLKHCLYKLIYFIVHPAGWRYIKNHGKRLRSKHLVMSTNELLNLYSSQEYEYEKDGDLYGNEGWRGALSSCESD